MFYHAFARSVGHLLIGFIDVIVSYAPCPSEMDRQGVLSYQTPSDCNSLTRLMSISTPLTTCAVIS